jgi:hypothetical protein
MIKVGDCVKSLIVEMTDVVKRLYYRKRYGITDELMEKYGDSSVDVVKIKRLYEGVVRKNPEMGERILEDLSLSGGGVSGGGMGYIYCMKDRDVPGRVKIGMTRRGVEERLREANRADTWKLPGSYEIKFAKYVLHPEEKERRIHEELSWCRIHPKREFFSISEDEVRVIFDKIQGVYWEEKVVEKKVRKPRVKKVIDDMGNMRI